MDNHIRILITDPVDDACVEILKGEGFCVDKKTGFDEAQIADIIGTYHVLIVRSGTQVTRTIIERGTNLKIIGRAGTGVDNIDLDAATRCGVIVMNTPGGNTISTAEHTISLLMSLARNIPQAWLSLREGKWDRKKYQGVELFGKTVGIIGLGKVGKEVATRLQAFEMKVIGYDPLVSDDVLSKLNIESVSLDELLRRSDYITIHTPLTDDTRSLLNQKTLLQCKRGVRIVNCARGGIIDEHALFDALNEGHVAGAALDVFEKEPPGDNQLLKHPNVIATPHLGASTVEAQEKVAYQLAHQIADALKERSLVGAVNISAAQFSIREDHKPYLGLAERMGLIAGQIMEGKLKSITFTTAGEGLHSSFDILKAAVLRGVLSPRLDHPVNDVNAPYFARELGIGLNDRREDSTGGNYSQLITVAYETDKEKRKMSGTVFGTHAMRIVMVDDYRVEVEPTGYMLFYWNIDRPGMLAAVGSVLAKANINIAGLSLGRKEIGKEALTIIDLDSEVPLAVLGEIAKIDGVINPKLVKV